MEGEQGFYIVSTGLWKFCGFHTSLTRFLKHTCCLNLLRVIFHNWLIISIVYVSVRGWSAFFSCPASKCDWSGKEMVSELIPRVHIDRKGDLADNHPYLLGMVDEAH